MIGHPSPLGGADTELDHQMRCWAEMGIRVHVCHTGAVTADLERMGLTARGCVYHAPRDWASLDGLDCISFCNGEFLAALPEIKRHARSTTFVNCMTFNFDLELEMQARGLIDFHVYQTDHGMERVGARLRTMERYRPLRVTPYFHAADFPFHERRPADAFRFGRISRADPGKFHPRQLWIYETMTAPVPKAGLVVGWSDAVAAKVGRSPEPYIAAVSPGWTSAQEFYRFCDAVVMSTDTFENLPRVGFEAMASGSILVVDDRGGWRLQVESGRTGWLCADEREFVYRSSRLAFEPGEREEMRRNAKERLLGGWGFQAAAESWADVFRAVSRLQ
ncbi:MAG TPA: glycosyltransferase [Humisphaera sp.]